MIRDQVDAYSVEAGSFPAVVAGAGIPSGILPRRKPIKRRSGKLGRLLGADGLVHWPETAFGEVGIATGIWTKPIREAMRVYRS